MDIRREIDLHALPADQPVLHWLFSRYHWESQWRFVATCTMQRHGVSSYQTHRVWAPTTEGRVLFTHQGLLDRISDLEKKLEDADAERQERGLLDEDANDH